MRGREKMVNEVKKKKVRMVCREVRNGVRSEERRVGKECSS